VAGADGSVELSRGEIAFVSPDEGALRFQLRDGGSVFVATDNR
jgi:hypothetical protein